LLAGHATVFITPSDNLPIGTPVSGWNRYRILFRCQVTAGSTHWKVREQTVSTALPTGVTWNATFANNAASVHTSNELQPLGLGWAGAWFLTTDTISYFDNGYGISTLDTGVAYPQFGEALPAADSNGDVHLGITLHYRLIKISDAFNANIDAGAISAAVPTTIAGFTLVDQTNAVTNPAAYVNILSPTITFAKRTCATPSWPTIRLPMIMQDELTFVGATGPEVEFNLQMNCPTHLGEVGYYFTDTNGFYDQAQGIINIAPGSAAQGIALKLQTRMRPHPVYLSGGGGNPPAANYGPIQFGPGNRYHLRNYTLFGHPAQDPLTHRADFSMSSDSGSDIPMKVSVVRTGNVVPGKFTASLIVVFVYR